MCRVYEVYLATDKTFSLPVKSEVCKLMLTIYYRVIIYVIIFVCTKHNCCYVMHAV